MTKPRNLGPRLRNLRKSRRLTLQDLSRRSGVAVSTISKIENGALSPTLDKVQRLAQGLEMTLGRFIIETDQDGAAPRPNSRLLPVRAGDGIVIDTRNYEYNYLCADLKGKRMVPIRARIKAGGPREFGPLERHGGEEFLFVLEGSVTVHTEFYAPVTLLRGEGVYLDSTMGHAYVNAGAGEAEVICICTDPQRREAAE
ncbi:MAG: helix-turn-helix domain-containing protein [Pikeienuella sp.]